MNGNPFYVPPVIPDMSDTILQFGQLGMKKDELAAQRSLEEKKFAADDSYRNAMLKNANEDLALKKEELYSKNPNLRPYSNGEYTKLLVGLQTAGIPTDKISFISGPLKEMAQNPDFKRGDVANMMEQKWPDIYNQTSEEVRSEILSLSKKAANMSPMDPKYKEVAGQIEKLGQFQSQLDNIKNPKEIFFKDIYDYEANTKAALAAQGDATRAALMNPETQFINNKTVQYMKGGLSKEDATVKAYNDLSAIRARQAREGKSNISINQASGGQVDVLAKGILDGTINPDAISKRGGLQAAVWAKVKEYDPSFNIVNAGAAAKFTQGSATMQTKALLNAIDPLLNKLDQAGAILGNSSVPLLNRAKNFLKEQTGSADIVGFNNLRDDTIAEVERGLLNTGVLSDSKYMRALKNVNSAQSYPQLKAALANMRIVINARLEALAKGPNAPIPGSETNDKATSLRNKYNY